MRDLWCYEEKPLKDELAVKVTGWATLSQEEQNAMLEPPPPDVQAENCVEKVGELMKRSARALDALKKEAAKKQEFQQKRKLKDADRAAKEAEKAAKKAEREARRAAKKAERETRKAARTLEPEPEPEPEPEKPKRPRGFTKSLGLTNRDDDSPKQPPPIPQRKSARTG